MRLSTLVLGPLFTLGCGTPVKAAPRQAAYGDVVLTTGVSSGMVEGHAPIRREIRDLKNSFPEQYNLFILGLRSFQLSDQKDPESFYEISGIHGRPYKVWQGAENRPGVKAGYCTHGNPLFLSWHRPYVALFEQTLSRHMHEIAGKFSPSLVDRYIKAAEEFRLPYWDWGLGPDGGTVPEYFVQPVIEVTETTGLRQTIPNPLYHYEFHPLIPGDFEGKWANMTSTVRWPTTNQANGKSQDNLFVRDFESRRRSFRDSLSSGFSFAKDLLSFSRNYLEVVHGNIHYTIGAADPAPGHMWNIDYSAFEPLFMLHHCNVDRLFAMWQVAHPDQRLEPSTSTSGNMFIAEDTIVDENTPLLPFYKTANTFWTTNDAWDTAALGYDYPETQCWKYNSTKACGNAVNATIAQMYISSTREMLTGGTAIAGTSLRHLLDENSFIDWNIQVQGVQSTLPPTFIVMFFLDGEVRSNSITEIGAWSAFTSEHSQAEAKKSKRASTLQPNMKGTVSLTPTLLDLVVAGELNSLDENEVVPFLKKRMNWTLQTGDGAVISRAQLDYLKVEVVSTKARIPNDPKQPIEYSNEWITHPDVTAGR